MLLHVVLFNFKPEVGEGRREEIFRIARERLPRIPGVTNVAAGAAVKPGARFSHAIALNLPDRAALEAYRAHPEHIRFRDEEFVPFIDERESLDYAD